jgi:hypothetical protein
MAIAALPRVDVVKNRSCGSEKDQRTAKTLNDILQHLA